MFEIAQVYFEMLHDVIKCYRMSSQANNESQTSAKLPAEAIAILADLGQHLFALQAFFLAQRVDTA